MQVFPTNRMTLTAAARAISICVLAQSSSSALMSFGSSATSISQSKRNDDLCSVILHTMVPQPEFVATNLDRDGATFPLNPALGLTQLGHLLGLVRRERALGPRVPLHHGGSQVVYGPHA